MNLSKHITELLKYNECVIIPELGAFITNYRPARFDATGNKLVPPSKEVIFNAKIKRNDGLLISFMVEKQQINYQQAQEMLMHFTDSLYERLNKGEKIKLEDLGTFRLDKGGSLVFEPTNEFPLLQAYGLTEVQVPSRFETRKKATLPHMEAVKSMNSRADFLKVAASIALVLTLSLFPVKTDKINQHSSVLDPIALLLESTPASTKNVQEEIESEPVETVVATAPYILVGGCFQHQQNASGFHDELLSSGFHPEIVLLNNGFYRVIIDSYTSKDEAINAMNTYRQNHQGSGVWVSKR
jgi:nucleoid DNA-binding protein